MKFIRKIGGFLKVAIPALVGLALLVLIIAWLAGIFVEKIQPGETAEIRRTFSPDAADEIEEVHEVVKVYISEAVGTLKAATRTEISARIMSPITEIRVKAGNVVRAGQTLVTLDRRDAESRLNQPRLRCKPLGPRWSRPKGISSVIQTCIKKPLSPKNGWSRPRRRSTLCRRT